MRTFLILTILILSSFASRAQDSPEWHACNDGAKAQSELNQCASDEAGRADDALNKMYAKVIAAAGKDVAAVRKIKAAERAWLAYRDTYLAAMYPADDKQATYGSIYPMEVNLVRAKLTRQQTEALKDILEQFDEPK